MKDYYATLGVTPQAEDIVIKAAYRALAQRYHPDRYSGPAEEATRKMADINEAYAVLSDPTKRKEYDNEYQQTGGNEGDFDAGNAAADEGVAQLNQDWNVAVEYYPDLAKLEATLAKTSRSLAFTFRLFMIAEKKFAARREVAETLHSAFLKNYFGSQPAIIDFAKTLISIGRKDAAKALNEAVRVLGDEADAPMVIHRIKGRFGLFEQSPSQSTQAKRQKRTDSIDAGESGSRAERLARIAAAPNATFDELRNAIEELNGRVTRTDEGCSISIFDEVFDFTARRDAVLWFANTFFPRLYFS